MTDEYTGPVLHIREESYGAPNDQARMLCGMRWPLPNGHKYFFEAETGNQFRLNRVNCPGCNPAGVRPIGTPLSQLSGRPGHPGFAEFTRIARSYGHE